MIAASPDSTRFGGNHPQPEVIFVRQGLIEAVLSVGPDALLLSISRAAQPVIEGASLGFVLDGAVLGASSAVLAVEERTVTESFEMLTGKKVGSHSAEHREVMVRLRDVPTGREWALVLRVAADGVAFAYQLPSDSQASHLGLERTLLPFPEQGRMWMLEYQTWYETERRGLNAADLPPGHYGFPALVQTSVDGFVLITESGIDERSSGAHLRYTGEDGPFLSVVAADDVTVCSPAHRTPWRVLIVGSLSEVVSSNLVDQLAPAAVDAGTDLGFVRPGRAAWSWWSSQYSGAYFSEQTKLVDFAFLRGWEHILVDCGWDATWVPDLVSYSSARGIQVHLWSNWADLDSDNIEAKLGLWKSWGVAGIKVDFMESESQERYAWYRMVLEATRLVGLMVNFHGSVIPRGWARTYPHVVSYEAVRGAEYYTFYEHPLTASHNVIQPFTRNVVGSMDYTPVTFSAPRRVTSAGHELGLSVVFESGITHFADSALEYESRPLVTEFLAELAPYWHETRLLSGSPDSEAVIARRFEDRWFIGCIATGPARTITVDVAELVSSPFDAWFVCDSPAEAEEFTSLSLTGETDTTLSLSITSNGGFAGIVAATGVAAKRAQPRAIAPVASISPSISRAAPGVPVGIVTHPDAVVSAPPGWTAARVPDSQGSWVITAPSDARPGSIGVIAAAVPSTGIPVIAHARLFVPHSGDPVALSTLPMLSATNTVGPVEWNESNGGGDPRDGHALTIRGEEFAHGFGVSDHSALTFFLGGDASSLSGLIGVDDETPETSGVASIWVDGVQQLSVSIASGGAATPFFLDLRGAETLELKTAPTSTLEPDSVHIDWADLYLGAKDDSVAEHSG